MISQNNSVAVRGVDTQAQSIIEWSRPEQSNFPLRAMGRAFARRWAVIAGILFLLNGLAFFLVTHLTPRFTAEADILIGPRQQQVVVELKAVLAGLTGESDVIESELQVLRSREIAHGVVQQLELDKLPEFNSTRGAPGLLGQAAAWFRLQFPRVVAMLPGLRSASHVPERTGVVRDPLADAVDAFLRRLGVAPRGRSRVIGVSFDSTDPVLAAATANAVADHYIAAQLKLKRDATIAAHKWLNERVAELREQLINADAAVQDFRRRSGLTQGRSGPLIAEQITETAQEIIKARSIEADIKSRLDAANAGRFHALGLEQASQAAHERLLALEKIFNQLRIQSDVSNQRDVELRVLQREADALRALYDRLLVRLNETNIESGLQVADAQIISRAEIPIDPTFPHVSIILVVVFVASCMFAGLLAFMLESLDSSYTGVEQVERLLGAPVLGVVPLIRRRRGAKNPETMVIEQPDSQFCESIRSLYTSLVLSRGISPPRVILIASAQTKEGKTSTALALGRLLAHCGKRVAIVDCDLHGGRLQEACGLPLAPGLVQLLDGTTTLEDVTYPDSYSPARIIPTGMTRYFPPDLIGSDGMAQTLAALRLRYDMVILDSAPLLGVSDTRNICRLADRTVLLIRWKHTRQSAAAVAARYIVEAGGEFAGCLLTKVNARRYSLYGEQNIHRAYLKPYALS